MRPSLPAAASIAPLIGLALCGGLLASSEALLVPRLQIALDLGFSRALLVQFFYYTGYLLFALPAWWAAERVGTNRTIAVALAAMAIGCALLAAAQATLRFPLLVSALLMISAGVAVLQIAGNGAVVTAGRREGAGRRLTLVQGFNSFGTVLGPLLGAGTLLGTGHGPPEAPFLLLGLAFASLCAVFARRRDGEPCRAPRPSPGMGALIRRPRMLAGIAAIFAYVGAEVTIGSLAVAFLTLPSAGGIGAVAAGRLVSLYWGGAMIGRFAGVALLGRVAPARLLGWASGGAILLAVAAVFTPGIGGSCALLGIGLCNSVMFPLIYGLSMPDDARNVPAASALLCMAVAGGAAIPMLSGVLADRFSLRPALLLPASCYLAILLFARHAAMRRKGIS